jgi:flagellar motility protein MotE (MotC chaperone)
MRFLLRREFAGLRRAAVAVALASAPSSAARAEEGAPAASPDAAAYCASIVDAAADARHALQMQALAELQAEVEDRIAELEARRAELQEWLARREAFAGKAEENVVAIYARMRPDAAAAQLVAMDEETAAAVLAKLNPRSASAILNEMDAKTAAGLAHVMAGQSGGAAEEGL